MTLPKVTTRQRLYRALKAGPATSHHLQALLEDVRLDTIQSKLWAMHRDGVIRIWRYDRNPVGGNHLRTYCLADGEPDAEPLESLRYTDHGRMMRSMAQYKRSHGFVPPTYQLNYAPRKRRRDAA